MKVEPTKLSQDEYFVHSALEELVRNETESDDDLVQSILVATVDRKPAPVVTPSKAVWQSWVIGAASVAAVVLLLFGVLHSLPYGGAERTHSQIQFTVTLSPQEAEKQETTTSVDPEPLVATRYRGEVGVVFTTPRGMARDPKDSPESFIPDTQWSYPLPVALASEETLSREEKIEIDSDSVSRDAEHLVYTGNVQLRYRSFLISADKIRLLTEPGGSTSAFLTAENASFSSEEEPGFPVVAAEAGQLEMDPVTGLIRLQEVALLETLENGEIAIVDTQAVSITAAGYAIETRHY